MGLAGLFLKLASLPETKAPEPARSTAWTPAVATCTVMVCQRLPDRVNGRAEAGFAYVELLTTRDAVLACTGGHGQFSCAGGTSGL